MQDETCRSDEMGTASHTFPAPQHSLNLLGNVCGQPYVADGPLPDIYIEEGRG